jgi:ComF family protein
MRAWALAALDLIFPAFCPSCRSPLGAGRRDPLCGPCFTGIVRIVPPLCARCGLPLPSQPTADSGICLRCLAAPPAYDYARAVGIYAGTLRAALHALKFQGKRAVARPLAELMLEQRMATFGSDVDALVPVPLARHRLAERGYNQAELIAERLAAALSVPLRRRGLLRVRETSPQSDLTAAQRRANVDGAFVATSSFADQHIVMIDDILTTGATASACARALRAAGARRIGVATVARVVETGTARPGLTGVAAAAAVGYTY